MEGQYFFKNIIENLRLKLDFSRKNSTSTRIDKRRVFIDKSKKNAIMKIDKQIINQGLSYEDVKNIVTDIVDQKILNFQDEGKKTYINRTLEFKDKMLNEIKRLPEEDLIKLKDPAIQLSIFEATRISGKREFNELRDILSNLVIGRIKNVENFKDNELKNIVYDEAIKTIEKITIDQLKIITLCFIFFYCKFNFINNILEFRSFINNIVNKFIDFKISNAEFQHIEYSGCGSMSIGERNLIGVLRESYPMIFLKSLNEDELNKLNIKDEIKKIILVKDNKENIYNFISYDETVLRKILRDHHLLNIQEIDKIIEIYKLNIKNGDMIEKELLEYPDTDKLLKIFMNTPLKNLNLTSVGIVIATTYYEQIIGMKLNIDNWIY